ncbi:MULTISPECIES: ACT domain-containing protein [Fusobacterium]|uniref:ACT domain-containing protein n=1 Tax=Fusobacterium TaxID=848 RepID=UPI0014774FD9|nr:MULTISPECIES: ACT domain-containing protein [Fusobacterium]NME35491.1 ACT domain-containing protein [Fusobacterium sp. FSA-380-WT-3A]
MKNKYLIVSKEILPDYFDKVIEARELLEQGKVKNISEAVKIVGISRSTYYKYKDFVFLPSDESHGRRALISITLEHTQGSLSNVLNYISSVNGNILTINQNMPMNDAATVIILMEVLHLTISIEETIEGIKRLCNVINCKLMSIE